MIDKGAWLLGILVFFFGASIGSFVNVLAYRLPREISIVRPASFCPHCRHPIPFWCNVPVLGYLMLRGRCTRCDGWIPARYLVTEIGMGLIAFALFTNFDAPDALARLVLCAGLFVASWVDLDWRIIPDVISLPGILVGFVAASLVMPDVGWKDSLIGTALGGGVLFAVGEIYLRLRGKEGMGLGDVKLLAMIGAFLGFPGVLFIIFFGSCLGAVGGVVLGLLHWQPGVMELDTQAAQAINDSGDAPQAELEIDNRTPNEGLLQTPVPFGPFLSMAAAFYALFQPQLVHWYLS